MRSAFFGLELGKRGLLAQRYGLDVTGQNVTNANTEGYSRQRADAAASTALWMPGTAPAGVAMQLGTGVTTVQVRRAENELLATQTRTNLSIQGRIDEFKSVYDQLEGIFAQPDDSSLDALITDFFASWQQLSLAPEEEANRLAVRESADAMAQEFQRIDTALEDYRGLLNDAVSSEIGRANTLLTQVGQLNNEIARVTGLGGSPNDLLDRRDVLVQELASIVPVQVKESGNRSALISVDGRVVVQDSAVRPIGSEANWENGGFVDAVYSDRPDLTLEPEQGSLGALVYARDRLIPAFLEDLDELARSVAQQVNAVHSRSVDGAPAGYGLDGLTGRDFFAGDSAATIRLSDAVAASTRAIQAGLTASVGDGDNALAIAQLRAETPLGSGTLTFDGYYQALMADLGAASEHMTGSQETQSKLMSQLESLREQELGVSLDEEFVALIRYQQGYQAAARLITTVDEGLDRLINGTGRVGI